MRLLIRRNKVLLVITSMIFFSFVYMFISDDEWYGVNKMKDIVKEEITKDKIEDATDTRREGFSTEPGINKNKEIIAEIGKAEKKVDEIGIVKSQFETYFNRLYFSIITGCLLGYGDIYPESMRLKSIVILQALLTIIIIVM